MQRIILLGAGPHAEVVADMVEQGGLYQIVGVTDVTREVGDRFRDYEVIGAQDDLANLVRQHDVHAGIVCLGENVFREKVVEAVRVQLPDFAFANAIHPSAVVAPDVELGEGSVVMAGCAINTGAKIGRHCILNTRSVLEHHGVMGDYASLGPGVVTGGSFSLGQLSAMAIGSVAAEGVSVGSNSVIGAGSVLLDDVGDDALAVGAPAKVVRRREPGEPYLT
jgi:sugar O-acyltransferase (sialic acid O-acetyltransferase NeuD family)